MRWDGRERNEGGGRGGRKVEVELRREEEGGDVWRRR